MNESYPVPPAELVGQWLCSEDYLSDVPTNSTMTITSSRLQNVATQAARWGYQQFAKEFAARGQREWREDETY